MSVSVHAVPTTITCDHCVIFQGIYGMFRVTIIGPRVILLDVHLRGLLLKAVQTAKESLAVAD